jgi:hypothetical protein
MKQIILVLDDKKVRSKNIQFVIDIKDYVDLASKIVSNNVYQRNRVSRSNSVYSLLKEDILKGCIIPPIVLASTASLDHQVNDEERLDKVLEDSDNLKILDGLQRTLSIIEVYRSNQEHFAKENYQVRAEVYLSISEIGILYRMLTLNTGQTPMTLRHQLEILFSKYSGSSLDEINILKETDEESVKSISDYRFADLIEGYNSFLEKNELPLDRFDILQTVKTIEFISDENAGKKIEFPEFVRSYHALVRAFDNRFNGWTYPVEAEFDGDLKTIGPPFGKTVHRIFNRSQALTGYGAAVAELIHLEAIDSLESIEEIPLIMRFSDDDLLYINKALDDVRDKSKKIGTGQRIFFKLFFRYLLDREGGTYCSVYDSLEKARKRALAEV